MSAVKIDRRVLFPSAHVPACDFLSFFEFFFWKTWHCALRFCGIRQFFLGYFGYFNFERRYCVTLQTCGMRCFIILDGILITDYSPSPSTYFFANYQSTRQWMLLILFTWSKSKVTNSNSYFRVICSKLDVPSSGCGMTSSFDSADERIAICGDFIVWYWGSCGAQNSPNVTLHGPSNYMYLDRWEKPFCVRWRQSRLARPPHWLAIKIFFWLISEHL